MQSISECRVGLTRLYIGHRELLCVALLRRRCATAVQVGHGRSLSTVRCSLPTVRCSLPILPNRLTAQASEPGTAATGWTARGVAAWVGVQGKPSQAEPGQPVPALASAPCPAPRGIGAMTCGTKTSAPRGGHEGELSWRVRSTCTRVKTPAPAVGDWSVWGHLSSRPGSSSRRMHEPSGSVGLAIELAHHCG